ncbi:hypothetical protein [Micromonospora sp. AKA38]|uniref:hypothetical protein n=1 Tax=Micromonospora sp. AKA38 TaxID=2733861 RepID=UPI0024922C66|nr:hypothetical protein [Micromonospora sp. AKA38]
MDEDLALRGGEAMTVEDVAGEPDPAEVRQLRADRDDPERQGAVAAELHRGAAVDSQQVTRLRTHRYQ